MICGKCNAETPGSPRFCPKCGAKTVVTSEEGTIPVKECPQCGAINPIAAKFCKADGYRFDLSTPPAPEESELVTLAEPPGTAEPMPEAEEPMPTAVSHAEELPLPDAGNTDLPSPSIPSAPSSVEVLGETIVCPQCGTLNPPSAEFCKKDGVLLASTDAVLPVVAPNPFESVESETAVASDEEMAPHADVRIIDSVLTPPATPSAPESVGAMGSDTIACPKCGTPNPVNAKFCRNDGVLLSSVSAAPQAIASLDSKPPSGGAPSRPVRRRKKAFLVAGIAGIALLASGAGGYLYWAGHVGDRQGSVAQNVNADLASKGLSNVKISVGKDWNAVAAGMVVTAQEKEQALASLRSYGELHEIIDNIRVKPTRADLEQKLAKILSDGGLPPVTVQLDDTLTIVTLNDSGLGADDRIKAEQLVTSALTTATGGSVVSVVHETAPIRPADLNVVELNARLHGAGLTSISARVASGAIVAHGANVVLEGVVASIAERDRAIQLSLAFPGVEGVDIAPLSVAPATPPPVAVATAPPPRAELQKPAGIDPAKLEGEINRALREGGAGGITAQVTDNLTLTLKGSATSDAQKDRAFEIARRFRAVGTVKDRVFVVQ